MNRLISGCGPAEALLSFVVDRVPVLGFIEIGTQPLNMAGREFVPMLKKECQERGWDVHHMEDTSIRVSIPIA